MSVSLSEYRLGALWWTTLKATWRRFLYGPRPKKLRVELPRAGDEQAQG